jgi:hypothetical protein
MADSDNSLIIFRRLRNAKEIKATVSLDRLHEPKQMNMK